jgi:hypothetical protein
MTLKDASILAAIRPTEIVSKQPNPSAGTYARLTPIVSWMNVKSQHVLRLEYSMPRAASTPK